MFHCLKLGYTKILVGLGETSNWITDTFEIVDLESPVSKCSQPVSYPMKNRYAAGLLGVDEQPVICGGFDVYGQRRAECYHLDKTWKPFSNLPVKLSRAAMATLADNDSVKLIMTGGSNNSRLSSVYVNKGSAWERFPANLPTATYGHCMITFGASFLVIGGSGTERNVFVLKVGSETWNEGPSLIEGHFRHSCAKIKRSGQEELFSVIVAGGYHQMASVEILDDISGKQFQKNLWLIYNVQS
jgi:hypothetical protein